MVCTLGLLALLGINIPQVQIACIDIGKSRAHARNVPYFDVKSAIGNGIEHLPNSTAHTQVFVFTLVLSSFLSSTFSRCLRNGQPIFVKSLQRIWPRSCPTPY